MKNSRWTQLLDAQASEPLAHVDALLEVLALDETGNEAAGEGVTGAVGVGDLLLGDGVDGEGLDIGLALGGDDGRLGALGDDDDTLALLVGLRQVGNLLGDGSHVGGVARQVVRGRVGLGLGLVADQVVPVLGRFVQGVLEELGDKGRRHIDDEDLVVGSGLLAEGHDGRRADWSMC